MGSQGSSGVPLKRGQLVVRKRVSLAGLMSVVSPAVYTGWEALGKLLLSFPASSCACQGEIIGPVRAGLSVVM